MTTWFKLRDQHPTIDLPHAYASGPHTLSTWMEVGGRWVEIEHDDQTGITNHRRAWRLDRSEAGLYEDGQDLWIYRRDRGANMRTKVPCRPYNVSVSLDGARISCVDCRFARQDLNCWGSDVTVFRSDATAIGHFVSDLPGQREGLETLFIHGLGFLRDGTPLVVAEYTIPEVSFDRHCLLIAVDANGGRLLSDIPRMRDCLQPRSWSSHLPAGAESACNHRRRPRTTWHAAEVRALFGRPDRERHDYVFATVGGFFWYYQRPGVVIELSFVDDTSTLGDEAPLHQVRLLDPATYDTSLGGRDR